MDVVRKKVGWAEKAVQSLGQEQRQLGQNVELVGKDLGDKDIIVDISNGREACWKTA